MFSKRNIDEILDGLFDGVYVTNRERVIRYWSQGAERLSGFTASEVIGRSCKDDLLVHVDAAGKCLCGDGCPLKATLQDGQVRDANVFMRHKDGHRVPVCVRAVPIHDEKGNVVSVAETFHDATNLQDARHKIESLEKMTLLDALTGLPNRRCLELRLGQRIEELKRHTWPLAVVIADIDHFKQFNDRFGHAVGDQVLKMVGSTLARCVRGSDIAGRWGGDEFVGVLSMCATDSLLCIGQRMRMLVEKSYFTTGPDHLSATISIGIAEALPADTCESLMKRADESLYQSKSAGRNRVTVRSAIGVLSNGTIPDDRLAG